MPALKRRGGDLAALMMLLLLLAPVSMQAQEQGDRSAVPVFGETVDVRVVNIEVVVTNKQGDRVSGLGVDDFELLLDGESIPIQYFSEISEGVVQGSSEDGLAAPGLEDGEAVATSYLVFIDEYFSVTRDRDRMIDRLIEQVDVMGPRDQMAVVRYDGKGLERVIGWSRGQPLIAALNSAKRQRSQGLKRLMEQRPVLQPNELNQLQLGLAGNDRRLTLEERYLVTRLEEQLERVVRAGVSTLRSFAAPRGRKTMLLLSGGWPFDPIEYLVDDIGRGVFDSDRTRYGQIYDPLRDTANLLGYTIYPVDVPGFQTTAISVDSGINSVAASRTAGRGFFRETGLHRSLQYLAKETGGEAILNSNRDRLLEQVVADTRSYYWLGFSPQRQGDDQRHSIEVVVKRPGLKVRSRGDYFDFSREREVTLAVESALYFGAPPSEQPLSVKLGRGRRSGLRTMVTPLEMLIPAEAITILPGPGGFVGQLELRVAVLDADGATTDTPVVPLTLSLAERPAAGTQLSYSTKLKLRRKKHTLVVAVYDVPTGGILSTSLEVSP